jgi:hypothetical protein
MRILVVQNTEQKSILFYFDSNNKGMAHRQLFTLHSLYHVFMDGITVVLK